MSTSHSDNPFLGFSIHRAHSPPNSPNSPKDEIFTEEAPRLQMRTTPAQSQPASSFPVFPIITPIMNPFAVGHPTGLQTITAHGPPSSGSTRDRTCRSNNPFNPATWSSPFHSPMAENVPLPSSAGSGTFFPPSPINPPPARTPSPPAPLAPPPVTLQDTINMFTTAFTQSFAQVQHQLQPIVVQPPVALPARPDPTKKKLRAPDPFNGTETNKLQSFLIQCQLNFADRPSAFASD